MFYLTTHPKKQKNITFNLFKFFIIIIIIIIYFLCYYY